MLVRQLFERFLSEAAAAGSGSEGSEADAQAGAPTDIIDAAPGGLSPVSEGARYSDSGEEERAGSGEVQRSVPAPSPVPEGLAFNPLWEAQGGADQQAAAAGEAGHPAAQEQPGEQAAPAGARRVKLLKRECGDGAAAGAGAAGQPRLAGGKRKASVEAPEEAAPPATKRQARQSGAGGTGGQLRRSERVLAGWVPSGLHAPVCIEPLLLARNAFQPSGLKVSLARLSPPCILGANAAAAAAAKHSGAAAAKPAAKPAPAASKPAVKAALKAANGQRPAPPAKPSAAASQGQVPPSKPRSSAPGSSKSVAERARLAEEKHAARRAAALARSGKQ